MAKENLAAKQPENVPGFEQIAAPQMTRLPAEPEQPFESVSAHPARRRGDHPRDIVHGSAAGQYYVRGQSVRVIENPAFLPGHSHADKQDVRVEVANASQQFL